MTQVVILNASYEPLGATTVKHAVGMLLRKVAEVEEDDPDKTIGPFPWPRVVRLVRYVSMAWAHRRPASFSRGAVLARDRHTCAYCGKHGDTVDHVLPRCQGGETTWLNLVTACTRCNGRKDGRTPEQAGMRLRYQPYVPTRAQLAAAT